MNDKDDEGPSGEDEAPPLSEMGPHETAKNADGSHDTRGLSKNEE